MEFKNVARSIALSLLSATLLVSAAGAAASKSATIPVGRASLKSQAVSLKEVGRVVAPGIIQVNPAAIRNRRLVFGTTAQEEVQGVCIGEFNVNTGVCNGVFIVGGAKPN
jgi:hypothetical protein